jgi:ATP-dependent Lhr-like helicase
MAPSRAAPIAIVRRRDLHWLLVPGETDPDSDAGLSATARDVLRFLREAGASFLDDIIQGAHRLRSEAEDALWELVSAGRVTGDGFAGLRALISATQSRGSARARWHTRWGRRGGTPAGAGRWALLRAPQPPPEEDDLLEALARQYIKRYGVVFRDLLGRETQAPAWRDLVRIYRRMEMSGELRGGRLVGGFVGEQFAAPEAVEALRATRREERRGDIVRLSACDPLNLVGIVTPGARVQATLANSVVYRDGVPQTGDVEQPAPALAFADGSRPLA